MTEQNFWAIIESTRKNTADDPAEALTKALAKLPGDEIREFERWFLLSRKELYRWDLWGVAYIIGGGCSDDAFMDFRSWIIGQGELAFRNALKDPESLGDLADDDDVFYEELAYAAGRAFMQVTGCGLHELAERMKVDIPSTGEPVGEPWEEEDLAERFPKVAAKFDFGDE